MNMGSLSIEGIAWELAIALHIVADDHSHRQGNNGWLAHKDWEYINIADNKKYGYFTYNGEEVALDGGLVIEGVYSVARVDNMFNPDNKEKFDKALAAAKTVNAMYGQGAITHDVLRDLFPKAHFQIGAFL